jgi:hypothetical protein
MLSIHIEGFNATVVVDFAVLKHATHMPDKSKPPIKCAICGKPVSLEDSNVTEDGKAVHGECYFEKIKKRKSEQR